MCLIVCLKHSEPVWGQHAQKQVQIPKLGFRIIIKRFECFCLAVGALHSSKNSCQCCFLQPTIGPRTSPSMRLYEVVASDANLLRSTHHQPCIQPPPMFSPHPTSWIRKKDRAEKGVLCRLQLWAPFIDPSLPVPLNSHFLSLSRDFEAQKLAHWQKRGGQDLACCLRHEAIRACFANTNFFY